MSKVKTFFALTFLLLVFFSSTVEAQVVINEFSSGTSNDDWVELYVLPQQSPVPVDLSQYKLIDYDNTNEKVLSNIIDPGGFASFDWSRWLNNSGDEIKLIRISDNNEIDKVSYGDKGGICAPEGSQSIGRSIDGIGTFVRFALSTKAATNGGSTSVPCPTPTPPPTPTTSPTPTSTSTKTPAPTLPKSPTPVPTQKPTATPKSTLQPTVKATPTPNASETEEPRQGNDVALITLENNTPSPAVEVAGASDEQNSFPALALLPILGGLGLVGASILSLYKQRLELKKLLGNF